MNDKGRYRSRTVGTGGSLVGRIQIFERPGLFRHGGLRQQLRNSCSQGPDAQTGGGVAGKHFADSEVLGELLGLFVAGLAHDLALAGSVHDCLSDPTGAQGVPFQNLATPFL